MVFLSLQIDFIETSNGLLFVLGNVQILKLLIKNGATIDILDIDSGTPLHMAAQKSELKRCSIEF